MKKSEMNRSQMNVVSNVVVWSKMNVVSNELVSIVKKHA